MVMYDFTQMNLTLVSIENFNPADLYCLNDSPLQNTTNFPGCYGICANPDVSGIGNRLSLYIQTILTLWMAVLTPNPDDTLGAMLAAIAASFTVFAATLAQYAYNNITFHHTLITINLSNLPTIAFFAAILRLRLQPGVIPLGPKVFATPILILQFIACAVSVFLGLGLNSAAQTGSTSGGRGGVGGWTVAQPQCNPETQVIIFGRSLQFWQSKSLGDISHMSTAERIVVLVAYGIIIFLPFVCSFICLYLPETGTLRVFASAFHQEKRRGGFALFAFFILSNIWTGILIYATEAQIAKNKVLPGEAQWGAGQILAMLLIIIPLIGCLKILILEIGNHNTRARKWIKRMKLHRFFGIRFEPTSHPSNPGTPAISRPGTPRRVSKDQSSNSDIESGKKSPNENTETKSPNDTRPDMGRRRLSKRNYEITKPEGPHIVVPGEDSGPEDAPGSAKRPPLYSSRQDTLVGGSYTGRDPRRNSTRSIAAQSVRSTTGSVKVIVKPDGQMTRVLSRRSSMAGGRGTSDYEDDRKSTQSGRRLSKPPPEAEMRRRDSARSASRQSEDGYWSAAEDLSRSSRRGSAMASPRPYQRDDNDAATIRRNQNGGNTDNNDNDDPLSKYYWDPQRGWLERK